MYVGCEVGIWGAGSMANAGRPTEDRILHEHNFCIICDLVFANKE